MINKTRLIDEFIELVSVPCPSKDEKQEAELIMAKLRELGLEPEMDKAHEKTGGTCGNVWAYVKGTVPNAPKLLFEAHMDSVAPTTGTKVVRKDGVLYSDGTTTLGGDDKVGVAAMRRYAHLRRMALLTATCSCALPSARKSAAWV